MNIIFLFKEALRTTSRSLGQFLLSSAVQAICLLLLSLFSVITINVLAIARSATERAEIYVFVNDQVAQNPLPLEQEIAALAGVAKIRFVSKEDALEELRRDLGPDTVLLEALQENPLPSSIRITLQANYTTPENVIAIEKKLTLLPGVIEVWSGKDLLAQINQVLRTVIVLDIFILVLVAISAIFIVFQSTENSITSRAQEIEIMELVGASRTAIHIPFLIQGITQGIIAGTFAFIFLFLIYLILRPFVPSPLFPVNLLLALNLLVGVLLSAGGSLLALNYLPSTLLATPTKSWKKK